MYKTVLLVACVAVAGLKRAQVEDCTKKSVPSNCCITHIPNSPIPNKRCRLYSTTETAFSSFYLKPGSNFKLLKITVIVKNPYVTKYINIRENKISDSEKWYLIELKEEYNQSTYRYTYTAYIDGKPYNGLKTTLEKGASKIKFDVKGFPSQYAVCNPVLNVTHPTPSSQPAPVMCPTTTTTVPPSTTTTTVPPATTTTTVPPATTPAPVPSSTRPTTVPPATTPTVPSTRAPAPVSTVLPPKPASRPAIENHPTKADFRGDHYQTRYKNTPAEDKPNVASRSIITTPSLYIILTAGVPGTLLVVTVVVVILAIRRRSLAKGDRVGDSSHAGETGNSYFLCQQNLPDVTRNLGQNPDNYVYVKEADQGLVTFQGRGRRGRRDSEETML